MGEFLMATVARAALVCGAFGRTQPPRPSLALTLAVVVAGRGAGARFRRLPSACALVFRVLIAFAVVLCSQATPARARLTDPVPSDSNGNVTDTFTDADALFAWVATDISGGYICIVAADVTSGDCRHPAWG